MILFAFTANVFSQGIESIDIPDELRLVLDNYETYWQERDASRLASLFTEDGFILRPGHPPVRGRMEIENAYHNSGGPLVLHAYDYHIDGDLAIIIGGYTTDASLPDRGKFTLTLKKFNDVWLIHSDMDNGSVRN